MSYPTTIFKEKSMTSFLTFTFLEVVPFTEPVARHLAARFPAYTEAFAANPSIPGDALNEVEAKKTAALLALLDRGTAADVQRVINDPKQTTQTVVRAIVDGYHLSLEDQKILAGKRYRQSTADLLVERLAGEAAAIAARRAAPGVVANFLRKEPAIDDDTFIELLEQIAAYADADASRLLWGRPHLADRVIAAAEKNLDMLDAVLLLPLTSEQCHRIAALLIADVTNNGGDSRKQRILLTQPALLDADRDALFQALPQSSNERLDEALVPRSGSPFAPQKPWCEITDPHELELQLHLRRGYYSADDMQRLGVATSPACETRHLRAIDVDSMLRVAPGVAAFLLDQPHLAEQLNQAVGRGRRSLRNEEQRRRDHAEEVRSTGETRRRGLDQTPPEPFAAQLDDPDLQRRCGDIASRAIDARSERYVRQGLGAFLVREFGPGATEQEVQCYEAFVLLHEAAAEGLTFGELCETARLVWD